MRKTPPGSAPGFLSRGAKPEYSGNSHVMSDDDGSDHRAPKDASLGSGGVEPVVLPEHASAYYSPRSPPAVTSHRTIETAAVKLDSSLDPRVADTQRVSIDGLEPPPWLDGGSGPVSDAPTVLVPIVRARRFRRRLLAAAIVALIGATFGAWFGLMRETPSPPAKSIEARVESPQVTPTAPTSTAFGPTQSSSVLTPVAVPSAIAPAGGSSASGSGVARGVPRRVASSSSAWFKAEPPKAWIK